jgi:hypothetical protein
MFIRINYIIYPVDCFQIFVMDYKDLTNEEIATVVAFSVAFNCEEARRMFTSKFNKDPPPARTLRDWKERFMSTLSVLPRPRIGDHSDRRLSDEKRAAIIGAFGDCPTTSQRKVGQAVGVSLSSVNRVLKAEGMKAWKFVRVQELLQTDKPSRMTFCGIILEKQERDVNFISNLVFSDEATFHLNGSVNTHNQFIYSTDNPHAVLEEPMKSPAVTCWAMVSPRIGCTFKIIDRTMNGEEYLTILNEAVIPVLQSRRNRSLIYQQDGAPAHFSNAVRMALNEKLPNRWIGRGGPIAWPPRSPDLSLPDFWLWGAIRDQLYQQPSPQTLVQLKARLSQLLSSIDNNCIKRALESFHRRCIICRECGGDHFQQFL